MGITKPTSHTIKQELKLATHKDLSDIFMALQSRITFMNIKIPKQNLNKNPNRIKNPDSII